VDTFIIQVDITEKKGHLKSRLNIILQMRLYRISAYPIKQKFWFDYSILYKNYYRIKVP